MTLSLYKLVFGIVTNGEILAQSPVESPFGSFQSQKKQMHQQQWQSAVVALCSETLLQNSLLSVKGHCPRFPDLDRVVHLIVEPHCSIPVILLGHGFTGNSYGLEELGQIRSKCSVHLCMPIRACDSQQAFNFLNRKQPSRTSPITAVEFASFIRIFLTS